MLPLAAHGQTPEFPPEQWKKNALGIVENVRFSGATNPIPAPVPGPSSTPIQIYTPPQRSRNK